MSKTVDETLRVAGIILRVLGDGPKRWTELGKLTTKVSPSYGRFQSTLRWLLENGYVRKARRGIYEITDKGQHFTELLA